MIKNEITNAIKQICEEKNISYESVIDTIEQALAAAYRKDFGEKNQNIHAKFDPESGKTKVSDIKTVVEDVPEEVLEELETLDGYKKLGESSKVKAGEQDTKTKKQKNKKTDQESDEKKVKDEKIEEIESRYTAGSPLRSENKEIKDEKGDNSDSKEETKKIKSTKLDENELKEQEDEKPRFNPRTDIQISDAKKIKKSYKIGDEIKTKLEIPAEFGRMAAQTAKQVIIQRLREAERDVLYKEFKDKEGQVLTGIIQRQEGRLVLIDLGVTTAIIPPDQQVPTENYNSGQRYRVYIVEVRETSKGPEIVVSRTHSEIVKQSFFLEVPEIASGAVEIKAISREAGSRSKVAVYTSDESIDPIGSCVGQRGTRIQTIISELGGEKLDIIQYNEDPAKFIANSLSPAKVVSVTVDEKNKTAIVKVNADQLSLSIGKAGQNVRLAAKLTGWKIDIQEAAAPVEKPKAKEDKSEDKKSADQEIKKQETKKQGNDNKDEDKKSESDDVKKDKSKKEKKSEEKKNNKTESKDKSDNLDDKER